MTKIEGKRKDGTAARSEVGSKWNSSKKKTKASRLSERMWMEKTSQIASGTSAICLIGREKKGRGIA